MIPDKLAVLDDGMGHVYRRNGILEQYIAKQALLVADLA
jgi:hypothetical protein